jgi:hypothetical protein
MIPLPDLHGLLSVGGGLIAFCLLLGSIYHARRQYRKWWKRRRAEQYLLEGGTEIQQIEDHSSAETAGTSGP